jgi:small conductance mechanosensitive channel
MTIVTNNKTFADNIQNCSANPYVVFICWLNSLMKLIITQAITLLKAKVSQIPNVLDSPAPDV